MSNCKVIALTNQKGGVGKTTTAVNLGVSLVQQGKKVLLIDADAQANLTMALGYNRPDDIPITLSTLMQNIIDDKTLDVSQGIIHHSEGIDLLPSNIELSGFEVRLINAMSRERVLKTYVNEVKKNYDYVLIDCMPSLGMITINALAAADSVIIPTQPHYLSAKGLELLLRSVSIQKTFTGTNWFVEGDIHACFDSFNHHTIIRLLRKRIDDEMFLQLIWKFLKAGYMEQWTYNRTYSGVPQGSGVSPVLANVYLHELDKFMEEYAQKYNRGKKKQMNSDYKKVVKKASYYRCMGKKKWADLSPEERWERNKHLKMLEKQTRQLTPTEPLDETYKRIQYTRYADDFIIGVIGSKADAEQMKADVGRFLREELDLEMSETKTKVTHTGDRARFLGYDITVSRSQDLKKSAGGYKIRSNAGVVKLLVPREKWVGKLLEYHAIKIKINENGKERFVALHRGKLVNQSDIEILARYNAEVRGLYNYYAIANDSFKIGRFANLMKYSMYKTFACKYKTNVHEIKRRYCVGGLFTIAYDTRAGRKITTFYRDGFKRKESATKFDNVSELPQFSKYAKTNTLKQRVERHTCELCGKDCRNLEIHQVKKLKDLKGNAEWVLLMRKRRRKTLVVCPECHKLIHS